MARFLLLRNSIAPNDGRSLGKAADQAIAHVRRGLAGSFFVLGHGEGTIDAHRRNCSHHDSSEQGRATWMATLAFMLCFAAMMLASMLAAAGRAAGAREGRAQVRLHQAHRHGAARHRQGARLLRGRGPLRHARSRRRTGRCCSTASSAANSTAPTCSPASRWPPPSASAPRRDIVTPFSMDLNGNAITVSNDVWAMMKPHIPVADGKPVHPDQGRRAEARDRKVPGRGQDLQHGHGLPGLHAQLRAALLARGRRHPSRPLFAERRLRPDQGRRAALGDAAAANAGDARSRHHPRLLRRRAVEPGRRVQGHRRARRHRLRDLEEQPGEGVRHHQGVRRSKPQHDARAHQGAHPRRHVARREQQRQSHEGGRDPVASRNTSAPMRRSSPIR